MNVLHAVYVCSKFSEVQMEIKVHRTVFLIIFFNKVNYLHVLTGPLRQKFHADSKNDLKKFHTPYDTYVVLGLKFFD